VTNYFGFLPSFLVKNAVARLLWTFERSWNFPKSMHSCRALNTRQFRPHGHDKENNVFCPVNGDLQNQGLTGVTNSKKQTGDDLCGTQRCADEGRRNLPQSAGTNGVVSVPRLNFGFLGSSSTNHQRSRPVSSKQVRDSTGHRYLCVGAVVCVPTLIIGWLCNENNLGTRSQKPKSSLASSISKCWQHMTVSICECV